MDTALLLWFFHILWLTLALDGSFAGHGYRSSTMVQSLALADDRGV
jgi:hypothetical protein